MNAVLGFTEILSSLIKDQKGKSYLEAIRSSGKSLLTLINDILDLSKIEARKLELHYEPTNPEQIFKEVGNVFFLKISEKQLAFITEIDPDIPANLILDEVRLRQILFNLVGNAVKFTDKGHIKLTAKARSGNASRSAVDLVITVEDTGIGISPKSQQTIFEAFKQQDGQSSKKYEGTGLGLAITRRLVEMMNGTISVSSEPGKGSRFTIILPDLGIGSSGERRYRQDQTPIPDVCFERAVVLVVDDVKSNRLLIREYFEDTRIQTIEAQNGLDAITMISQNRPDLILMDIRMPEMDGYETTKLIRMDPSIRQIPIIALTASGIQEEKEKSLRSGFNGFLRKPVQKSDLINELIKHLPFTRVSNGIDTCDDSGAKDNGHGREPEEGHQKISVETVNQLPQIIEQLETTVFGEWQRVCNSGFFKDIESFGRSIEIRGQQWKLKTLETYGHDIRIQTKSYDIEKITQLLDAYPAVIDSIKAELDTVDY